MRSFIFSTLIIAVSSLSGCETEENRKDYVLTERNLIPEGTAFDTRTQTIYIGSTFKRKIVQITEEGKITDFIPEGLEDVTSIVGIEVDEERGILWANSAQANEVMPLMNPDTTRDWFTSISAFDIGTKKLNKKYDLIADQAFLNDLTVTPRGDVFATETMNNNIYRVNSQTDSLELFLSIPEFSFVNGITYSEKSNILFVSCNQGILKIDILTRKYVLLKAKDNVNVKGIDGLTLYKNRLIGHQSSKVSMFCLNGDESEIVKAEILDSGDEFDSSTTGEVGNGHYYFIVNSQIRSGIDKVSHTIKPSDSLKDVIIRRIKL